MAEVKVGHISKTKLYVTIDNISDLVLQEVTIPGQTWSVTFVKTTKTSTPSKQNSNNVSSHLIDKTNDVLVVNLNLEKSDDRSVDWACVASLSVKLLRSFKSALHRQTGPFVFDAKNHICGQMQLIKWHDLLKVRNGYINNDSCKFQIEIDAGPIQNTSNDQWLKFEIINKCCDNSTTGKFRLTINRLHETNQVCSPKIHFDNTTWRILLQKDKNLTVSLWKVETMPHLIIRPKKFITILKSFDQKVDSIKKTKKTTGIHPSPLELFSISWKDLVDPEKKFIENGLFIMDIEMKMILPDESKDENFDLECPICLGSMFTMNGGISVTGCGHLFCTACIQCHLDTGVNQLCPTCQQVGP